MSDAFDPYYIWLGIPPEDQPPHHYRLLGVTLFESNREVIEAAANRQMAYMQEVSSGEEHIDEAQNILGELSRARVCLLNSEKRAAYDADLRASFDSLDQATESTDESSTTASSPSKPVAPTQPQADSPLMPTADGNNDGDAAQAVSGAPAVAPTFKKRRVRSHTRSKTPKSRVGIFLGVGAGVILLVILFSLSQSDEGAARPKKMAERKASEKADPAAEATRKDKELAQQKARRKAERKAKAAAERKAKAAAERKAKAEAEQKAKAAEQKSQKEKEQLAKDREDAKDLIETKRLTQGTAGNNEPTIWYLKTEEADVYNQLKAAQTQENIERLQEAHRALMNQYTDLHKELNKKDSKLLAALDLLGGGELATKDGFPLWPDEHRAELEKSGLQQRSFDNNTVWILAAEATFLDKLQKLDSQRKELIELNKTKRANKNDLQEKAKEFSNDVETGKKLFLSLSEKYKNLPNKAAAEEKIASLGNVLGPTLSDEEWKKKENGFSRLIAALSRPKPGGKSPKPIYEFNKTLALDGTNNTRNAFTRNIGRPPFISAEAIIRVNSGRKWGSITGQALDNGGTEQGWQLGYNTHVFQWRVGAVGGRFFPQAESKTGLLGKKVHHVVGTYNGQSMKLYVDGVLQSTKPKRGPINYPASPFIIGGHVDNNEYLELNGTVYLVRVYAGALSDAQVRDRYNEVKGKIDELNN